VTRPQAPATDARQEALYGFPYHYLVDFDAASGGGFRAGRWYAGGLRYAAYMLHVERSLAREAFGSIVDVGCGDGWLASRLATRFPERRVVGVDVSPSGLKLASSMHAAPNLEFQSCDITRASPSGSPFDCGTLVEVLEHVPVAEVPAFVEAVGRLIRPGGKLFVTVPSTNLDVRRIERHHQHFTDETLQAALAPCFEVELCQYVNRKGRGDRWLRQLVTNSVFALTHERTLDLLFRQYMRHLFFADRKTGLRVFGIFRRKSR
jgi:SAM-dependent methyltransferase